MTRLLALVTGVVLASPVLAVEGEGGGDWRLETTTQKPWRGEITPYLWIVGMNADVTVGDTTVSPSVGFSDLMDAADFGGSLFGVIKYQRFIGYGQVDYLKTRTTRLDDARSAGKLDTDTLLAAFGAGYEAAGLWRGGTIGAMIGMRVAHSQNDLTLYARGSRSGSRTITDPLLILTPSFPITRWLRLNPTFSLGAFGDSDFTYELQPHLQLQLTEHVAARVGYRRLYMDYQGMNGEFKGSLQGVLLGLGLTL